MSKINKHYLDRGLKIAKVVSDGDIKIGEITHDKAEKCQRILDIFKRTCDHPNKVIFRNFIKSAHEDLEIRKKQLENEKCQRILDIFKRTCDHPNKVIFRNFIKSAHEDLEIRKKQLENEK